MRLRGIGCAVGICALLQILAPAAAQSPPANSRTPTQEECTRPTVNPACFDPTKLVDRVVYCANRGRSYVFAREEARGEIGQFCLSGTEEEKSTVRAGMSVEQIQALLAGEADVCKTKDPRIAPGSLLISVMADPRYRAGPVGLRVVGGIYCEELLLRELDIKHSVVLDFSVLLKGILVRTATIRGDLSFDHAHVAGELKIVRSNIEGLLFARWAVIEALSLSDSTIGRSANFTRSVFPGPNTDASALEIYRTKIGGDLLVNEALVGQLIIHNSQVGAKLGFNKSAFFESTTIDQSSVSGAVELQHADFSYLLARNNTFASTVDLYRAEFRCGVNFSKNHVGGDLNVVDSGFGLALQAASRDEAAVRFTYWTDKKAQMRQERLPRAKINAQRFDQITALTRSSNCRFESYVAPREVRLTDNRIEKNLCIKAFSFERFASPAFPRVTAGLSGTSSHLALNGTAVGGNTILSVKPADGSADPRPLRVVETQQPAPQQIEPLFFRFIDMRLKFAAESRTHQKGPHNGGNGGQHEARAGGQKEAKCPISNCVELLGFRSGGLVIDVGDSGYPFGILSTGMKFDRIFRGDVGCPYPRSENAHVSEGQMFLPEAREAIAWLDKTDSTQPHAAAIEAFERAGTDATLLKVRKAELEWHSKYQRLTHGFSNASAHDGFWHAGLWVVSNAPQYVHLVATRILGALADYGYRPTWAILWVVTIIVVYKTAFWLVFGIVAFKPDNKSVIRPIGLIFLFDRLLPVYQIRKDNYDIKEFYKWRYNLLDLFQPRPTPWDLNAREATRHAFFPISVIKATPRETRLADALLDILKMIGAVLAVFLVAAINALIAH